MSSSGTRKRTLSRSLYGICLNIAMSGISNFKLMESTFLTVPRSDPCRVSQTLVLPNNAFWTVAQRFRVVPSTSMQWNVGFSGTIMVFDLRQVQTLQAKNDGLNFQNHQKKCRFHSIYLDYRSMTLLARNERIYPSDSALRSTISPLQWTSSMIRTVSSSLHRPWHQSTPLIAANNYRTAGSDIRWRYVSQNVSQLLQYPTSLCTLPYIDIHLFET